MLDQVTEKINEEIIAGRAAISKKVDYKAALQHFTNALKLAQQNNLVAMKGRALLWMGQAFFNMREYDKAAQHYQQALVFNEYMSLDDHVSVYQHHAEVHITLNDPERALALLHKALDVLSGSNNDFLEGRILSSISEVFLQMLNYQSAIEYLERSLEHFRKAKRSSGIMRMAGNLANIYNWIGNHQMAEKYCAEMIEACDSDGTPHDIGQANMITASIHNQVGAYDKALEHAEKALAIGRQHGLDQLTAQSLEMLVSIFTNRDELDKALAYGLEAEHVAEKVGIELRLVWIYKALSDVFVRQKNYQQAYEYLNKYTEIRERLTQTEHQRTVAEMQARYDRNQLEREAERLRLEMEHRESEIALHVGNALRQQEFLEHLIKDLGDLNVIPNSRDALRTIIKKIESDVQRTSTWNLFEHQFKYIHADFIPTLVTRYPSLSSTEIKVCALTRLNLETKQIASVLCINHRTVQNHRNNIRRKLHITGDVDLLMFLMKMGE